jgi:hypothetical protein
VFAYRDRKLSVSLCVFVRRFSSSSGSRQHEQHSASEVSSGTAPRPQRQQLLAAAQNHSGSSSVAGPQNPLVNQTATKAHPTRQRAARSPAVRRPRSSTRLRGCTSMLTWCRPRTGREQTVCLLPQAHVRSHTHMGGSRCRRGCVATAPERGRGAPGLLRDSRIVQPLQRPHLGTHVSFSVQDMSQTPGREALRSAERGAADRCAMACLVVCPPPCAGAPADCCARAASLPRLGPPYRPCNPRLRGPHRLHRMPGSHGTRERLGVGGCGCWGGLGQLPH